MIKLLRWNVLVKHNPGRFFHPAFAHSYLSGIQHLEHLDAAVPLFSADAPVLYSRSDARFLVCELRRVGYNAYKRPWICFAIMQRRAAKRASAWK